MPVMMIIGLGTGVSLNQKKEMVYLVGRKSMVLQLV